MAYIYFCLYSQSLGLFRIPKTPKRIRFSSKILDFPKYLEIFQKQAFWRITLLSTFGHFLYLAIIFPTTPPQQHIESVLYKGWALQKAFQLFEKKNSYLISYGRESKHCLHVFNSNHSVFPACYYSLLSNMNPPLFERNSICTLLTSLVIRFWFYNFLSPPYFCFLCYVCKKV